MRSSCCRALLVLSLIVLIGCATGGDGLPRRSGLLMEPDQARQVGYVLNWATDLEVPGDHQLVAARVLGDLLVTVEIPGNLVTAVSMRDGSVRWRRVIGDQTKRLYAPARHGDQVLVNTDTRLYLLRASDGNTQDVQDLDGVVAMGPVVVDDLAVYGSIDGTVFAHDVLTEFSQWEYLLTARIVTQPVAMDGDIFVADSRGTYVMLDADGDAAWRGHTFGPVTAAPAMDEAAVYVASEDRSLYALNRNNGSDRWPAPFRADQALTQAPMAFGLVVLQPLPGGGVVALDSVDGAERWRLDTPALPIGRSGDDAILAATQSLLRVDLATGNVKAQGRTLRLSTVLEGPDGSLVLVSPGGRLLRMNPAQ